MRADTFAGQIIAVLSRRASAFELNSGEPQTFPGRLRALLSHPRHTTPASLTPTNAHQVTTSEKPQVKAPETAEPPASGHTGPPKHQGPEAREFDFGIIRALAHELSCRKPNVRLRVRTHAAFTRLEHSLKRGRHDLDYAHELTHDLDHDLRNRDHLHDLTLDLRNLTLDLRNLTLDLDRDLALASDLALTLTRDLRNRDLALASALNLALDRDLDRGRDLIRDRDRDLASDLIRDLDLDAVLADLDGALHDLDGALHDFTTADLREVDLTGVPLEGVRWSSATQWPADWAPQVALASVEVAPDVFEVREGNTHVPTSV
jgi:hypothetical protein